jgi:hypothetical protein
MWEMRSAKHLRASTAVMTLCYKMLRGQFHADFWSVLRFSMRFSELTPSIHSFLDIREMVVLVRYDRFTSYAAAY